MQIILAILLVLGISFGLKRLSDHVDIKQDGGIRTKYNKIFSFFYNMPNSRIGIETKSYVTFTISDKRCTKNITLNYWLEQLSIKCKITYHDHTAFNNGSKLEFLVTNPLNQDREIRYISEKFAKLP